MSVRRFSAIPHLRVFCLSVAVLLSRHKLTYIPAIYDGRIPCNFINNEDSQFLALKMFCLACISVSGVLV